MIMKNIFYIGCLLLLFSCSVDNIVTDAPIKYVSPEKTLNVEKDSTFSVGFPQVLSCMDIVVAGDSVMLLYDMIVPDRNNHFYKAYSLDDYSYLGEYVPQGRGPGELLAPDLSGTYCSGDSGKARCYLLDLMLGKSFCLDLSKVAGMQCPIEKISDLPVNTLYALPYRDSLQFIINIENDNFLFHIINRDSEKLKTFRLYPEGISAEQHLPQFGNSVVLNQNKGVSALVMLGIPQVNFLNLSDGTAHSIAVDKEYKNWRNILSKATNMRAYMDATQYYNNAASSEDYVMAVYINRKVKDLMDRKTGDAVHVHIFDWEGTFLYDLALDENVSRIDYDSRRKFLYGVDVNNGMVYRYDLSYIL